MSAETETSVLEPIAAPAHEHGLESLPDRIKPRQASTILLYVIVGFFVAFLVWANWATIDRTVRGPGKVIASSQLQTVSNLEGGVVKQIMVRTGQLVQAGQTLVLLDPTATGAELGSGEAQTAALQVKIARLRAEVLGQDPVYPPATNPAVAQQIQIERALHAARMEELFALSGAASARGVQAQRSVAEARSGLAGKASAAAQRASELDSIRPLAEKGIESQLTLRQAESAAVVARSEAAQASETIARAQAGVAEARASLAQARQDWRAKAADQLAQAQGELAARSTSLPALQARVARTTVRAPLAGRVNRVLVTTVGAAVSPGAPIIEISPSRDTLLVEGRIRPQDIARVRIGQRARVNITAYDSSVYGSMYGEVESMSPDAVVEERSQQQESFYIVRVRTSDKGIKDKAGKLLPIGAGMTAEVNLLGDPRTVMQYILTPITRLKETAFSE